MSNLSFYSYLALIFFIGLKSFKNIKNSKDFFIAGKNANVLAVTGSLLATILGSSAIIGSVNFATKNGWAGSWFMICAALGLFALYFLLPKLQQFKGYNLPELLGSFYGTEVNKIASIIIPIAWTGIVASQIMGSAMIITKLTALSYTTGIWVSGLLFIIYTCLGGQLSILKTDMIQFLFIIVGLLLCFVYTKSNTVPVTDPLPLINQHFGYQDLIILLLTYCVTFVVGPDIYSRIFCAKDLKTAKQSIMLSIIILLPLAYILGYLGIQATTIIGDKQTTSSLLYLIENTLPETLSILMYFCLLSAMISSSDTTLLTASSMITQIFTGDLQETKTIRLSSFCRI